MERVKWNILCVILPIIIMMAVLGGCTKQLESNILSGKTPGRSTENSTGTSETSTNLETTQSFTFQVNASMPIYKCITTISSVEHEQTKKIIITDAVTGKLVQSIIPPDNEMFTKSSIYFIDVTFSGNLALIIPIERAAHYVTFNAYIWDFVKKQFIETPSFQNIHNPSINSDNKRILSNDSSNQITSYVMFSFDKNRFISTNSIYWEPAYIESDGVSYADNLLHFVEKKGADSYTIVNDFYVPGYNSYDIDTNDTCAKSYFVSGSFWDLSSHKWQCTFYGEVKKD